MLNSSEAERFSESRSKIIKKPTDKDIVAAIERNGIKDIAQVGCSITDTISDEWDQKSKNGEMTLITTTNEHNLPGIAAGIYFGTGRIPLIHMQNSGLTNAGDGLISFIQVYKTPMTGIVTWRGSNEKDDSEPHQEIGRKTKKITQSFVEENVYGESSGKGILRKIRRAINAAKEGELSMIRLSPDAFQKTPRLSMPQEGDIFSLRDYKRELKRLQQLAEEKGIFSNPLQDALLSRDEALQEIARLHPNAAIFYSNGFTARAAQGNEKVDKIGNFYNVGYMGGTLAIGWGLATSNPDIEVVVVDGDQNAQMSNMKDHLKIKGGYPENLQWYILNNGIGASVGTLQSLELAPDYHQLARVIQTVPDLPGSFNYPRVGARGAYFITQEAQKLAENIGPLPTHAQLFRDYIQQQSKINKDRNQTVHKILSQIFPPA